MSTNNASQQSSSTVKPDNSDASDSVNPENSISYWGFVLISAHFGLHWSVFIGFAKRAVKVKSSALKRIVRAAAPAISGYGIYAFIKRDIDSYMLLKNQFVFFDFKEPLVLFMLDYIAIMGLFAAVGHYSSVLTKQLGKRVNTDSRTN